MNLDSERLLVGRFQQLCRVTRGHMELGGGPIRTDREISRLQMSRQPQRFR